MAPPPNPPSGTADRHRALKRLRLPALLVGGTVVLLLGVIIAVWGVLDLGAQWQVKQPADQHGATTSGEVRDSDGSQWGRPRTLVSFTPVGASDAVSVWIDVDGLDDLPVGQRVLVRYDTRDPERAYLPKYPPMSASSVYACVGAMVTMCGTCLLAEARRCQRGVPFEGTAWVLWCGPAGLTTWLGFGHVASVSGRGSTWRWTIAYGVGAVTAILLLLVGSLGWRHLEPLGVATWLVVWIGGVIHGLVLIGRVPTPAVSAR